MRGSLPLLNCFFLVELQKVIDLLPMDEMMIDCHLNRGRVLIDTTKN